MRTSLIISLAVALLLSLSACFQPLDGPDMERPDIEPTPDCDEIADAIRPRPTLVIEAGERLFYADFAENPSAQAFIDFLSPQLLTLQFEDCGGLEKTAVLPEELPHNNESMTAKPGDITLYQGNRLSVYYDENSSELTLIAHIDSVTRDELLTAFDSGNGEARLWLEWSE